MYKVQKKGQQYAVVKMGSGEEVGRHPTNIAAQAHVNSMTKKFNGETGGGIDMTKGRGAKLDRLKNAAGRRNANSTKNVRGSSNKSTGDNAAYADTPNEAKNQTI